MHPDLCGGRVVVVLANVVTCEQIFLTFPTEWMCVGPVMKGVRDRMPIVLSIACLRPKLLVQTVLTLKEIRLSEPARLPLPPLITPTDLTLHYERCLCFLPFSAATTLTFSDSEGLGGLGGPSDPTRNRRP